MENIATQVTFGVCKSLILPLQGQPEPGVGVIPGKAMTRRRYEDEHDSDRYAQHGLDALG
jgi:hypothetical protein